MNLPVNDAILFKLAKLQRKHPLGDIRADAPKLIESFGPVNQMI